MRETASHLPQNSDLSPIRKNPPRSYAGMILSMIFPGLGQFYLGKYLKGCVFIFVFISALVLFYMNSYPVNEWRDLLRFKSTTDSKSTTDDMSGAASDDNGSIHLWTLEDGKSLMFRPSWILKVTATIQFIVCWFYAASDGWRGRQQLDNS